MARLEQIAQTILQNLQSDSKTAATGDQNRAVTMLADMKRAKRQIQIAADGAYPYTNSNSATARRDFHLPTRRPFV